MRRLHKALARLVINARQADGKIRGDPIAAFGTGLKADRGRDRLDRKRALMAAERQAS